MDNVEGLTIYKAQWNDVVYRSFFGMYHGIVCADTGGNKNLRALQFMATGGLAFATNWSLNKNWVSRAYSCPLSFNFLGKDTRAKTQNEAFINANELCESMRYTIQNREIAQQNGSIASQIVPAMLDWKYVIDSLFRKIGESSDEGDKLRNKFLMTKPLTDENVGSWG